MSPLWRNRYTAVIGPDRVTLVRRRPGLRARFDLKAEAPVKGDSPTAIAEALAGLLARPEIGRGELTLLLSNLYVRYQLVPWNEDIGSPDEMQAFARISFEQVYGSDAATWAIEVSPEAAGGPRLAAAVEREFLERLRTVVAASPLRLSSIQPYLVAAFNRLGKSFRGRDFVFVVAEPARSCLLAAAGGRWSCVRAGPGDDSPTALAGLIERETQLLGFADGRCPPIYVHAPQRARLQLPAINGVNPQALAVPIPAALSAVADQQLAMAMTLA